MLTLYLFGVYGFFEELNTAFGPLLGHGYSAACFPDFVSLPIFPIEGF
jgi:hypothetical protein